MSRIIGVLVRTVLQLLVDRPEFPKKKMWKKGRGTTAKKSTASQLAEKLIL
jgi:hypothetical protein